MTQWTRDDLPSDQWIYDTFYDKPDTALAAMERIACDLIDHLNAHHPKPEQTMVPARPVSPEERGELWARIRDELRGVYSSTTDQDHRKLDLAASASADTAVEYLNDRGGLGIDAREPLERALRERDAALARAEKAERERDGWRAEWVAVNEDLKAVSRQSDLAHEQWQKWEGQARRAEAERDAAVERAEQAEREASTWRTSTESAHSDFLQAAHDRDLWKDSAEYAAGERDEWMSRAEQAERELKPSSPLRQQADAWMRIVNHPAISRALREKNRSYSDQVFERITWLFEAAEDARESNPVSAVSRADIEKAVRSVGTMRRWIDDSELVDVPFAVDAVCDLFAIEAEQAVDPVEAKVREIAEAMALTIMEENIGGHTAVSALDALARSAARHVLGQEASSDE